MCSRAVLPQWTLQHYHLDIWTIKASVTIWCCKRAEIQKLIQWSMSGTPPMSRTFPPSLPPIAYCTSRNTASKVQVMHLYYHNDAQIYFYNQRDDWFSRKCSQAQHKNMTKSHQLQQPEIKLSTLSLPLINYLKITNCIYSPIPTLERMINAKQMLDKLLFYSVLVGPNLDCARDQWSRMY